MENEILPDEAVIEVSHGLGCAAVGNHLFIVHDDTIVDDDIVVKEDYTEKILEVYKIKSGQNIGGVRGSFTEYFNETWISRTFRRLFFMTRGTINEKIKGWQFSTYQPLSDYVVSLAYESLSPVTVKFLQFPPTV